MSIGSPKDSAEGRREAVPLTSVRRGVSWKRSAQQVQTGSDRRGLRAPADVELREDVRHVGRRCLAADEQRVGDLHVGVAARDEFQDFELALGEPVRRGGAGVDQRGRAELPGELLARAQSPCGVPAATLGTCCLAGSDEAPGARVWLAQLLPAGGGGQPLVGAGGLGGGEQRAGLGEVVADECAESLKQCFVAGLDLEAGPAQPGERDDVVVAGER